MSIRETLSSGVHFPSPEPRMAGHSQENRSEAQSMTRTWTRFSAAIGVLCIAGAALAQNAGDPLKKGFDDPPGGARPRVWWHWMNGNISQEGIKLDLE